jgi:hypothetical protein
MYKKILPAFVVLSLVLGIFFRLYAIQRLPGGLFPDEAANGLDINLMEQGQLQPFYERGNGREALFFYWQWFWVKIYDRTPLAHHTASATVGIFSLVACYLVTKRLWGYKNDQNPNYPKIIAAVATFLMATSSWHIVLSRTGFRANLIPLFSSLTLWALLTVPKAKTMKRQILWSCLAGAFFALGFYTYIAFRIMVPLLILTVLWPWLAQLNTSFLKSLKAYLLPFLGLVVAFAIVIFPLANYFYTHPGSFVGRSGQVSVFNPELNKGDLLGTVIGVTKLSLKAYFVDGDLNWRHNISGRPFLSPLASPFFAIGLLLTFVYALLYFFRPKKFPEYFPAFLSLAWFLAMLLPVVATAEGIPHGLRSIGTIPGVFILSAFGFVETGRMAFKLAKHYPQGPVFLENALRKSLYVLAIIFVIGIPIEAGAWYFGYAQNSEENYYAFRSDLPVVSQYLKENGNRQNTYLILDKFSVQSVDYMTTIVGKTSCDRDPGFRPANCVDDPINKPYIQVDPERSYLPADAIYELRPVWPNGLKPGNKIVFTQSSTFDITKFRQNHPNSKLIKETRNKFGKVVLAVYEIE